VTPGPDLLLRVLYDALGAAIAAQGSGLTGRVPTTTREPVA
jgi:hypothetical protein